MNKKFQLIAAALLIAGLFLSACGGKPAPADTGPVQTAAVATYQAESAALQPATKMCDLAYGGLSFNQEAGTTKTWTKADGTSFTVTLEAESCNILKLQDPASGSPAGQPPLATKTANAPSLPTVGACSWSNSYQYDNDMRWGDNEQNVLLTVTVKAPNAGSGDYNALFFFEKGWAADIEDVGTTFSGNVLYTVGDATACMAEYDAYHAEYLKVWVGLNRPDDSWYDPSDFTYWKVRVIAYTEATINTGKASWPENRVVHFPRLNAATMDPQDLANARKNRTFCADGKTVVWYAQMWDGDNLSTTVDPIIWNGSITARDDYEGTAWPVWLNGESTSVLMRFVQMTLAEHIPFDKLKAEITFPFPFFGKSFTPPSNWAHAENWEMWDYNPTCVIPQP